MDDFNMNNKTPLNSSDQNNEQPAAETRNTAPQNEQPAQAPQSEQTMQQPQAEQPAQAPQSEQTMQQPQAEQPAQAPQSEQTMQQPQAEQPAQAPQSEQPQAEEPRTPFQTPVQHPEFHQAQQQTGFGEVPPMSQKPHTPKNKKHSRGLALGLCGVAAACLLFAGGAVVGNMAFGGNANSDSGTSASTSDSAPTLQINSKPESDSSNSSDNYDTADGMAGEDIYKKGQSVGRIGYLHHLGGHGQRLGRHHEQGRLHYHQQPRCGRRAVGFRTAERRHLSRCRDHRHG